MDNTNDAANLTRMLQAILDYGWWMWEHPMFKPIAVILIAILIFRMALGPRLTQFVAFQFKRVDAYFEGKQMRYEALTREQSLLAQDIAEVIDNRVDKGDLTEERARYYFNKLGHVLPLLKRGAVDPNELKKTPLQQLKDRLDQIKAHRKPKHPRDRLSEMLNGKTTAAT